MNFEKDLNYLVIDTRSKLKGSPMFFLAQTEKDSSSPSAKNPFQSIELVHTSGKVSTIYYWNSLPIPYITSEFMCSSCLQLSNDIHFSNNRVEWCCFPCKLTKIASLAIWVNCSSLYVLPGSEETVSFSSLATWVNCSSLYVLPCSEETASFSSLAIWVNFSYLYVLPGSKETTSFSSPCVTQSYKKRSWFPS